MISNRSTRLNHAYTRGSGVFGVAVQGTNNTPGFVLIVEGDESQNVAIAHYGEKIRDRLQEGCLLGSDHGSLIQDIRAIPLPIGELRVAVSIRTKSRAWIASYGAVGVYRWSPADALGSLNPKVDPALPKKWFSPRKAIRIQREDRILAMSHQLTRVVEQGNVLYLHANEIESLVPVKEVPLFAAAWCAFQDITLTVEGPSSHGAIPETQGRSGKTRSSIRVLPVLLLIALIILMAFGTFLLLGNGEDGESDSNTAFSRLSDRGKSEATKMIPGKEALRRSGDTRNSEDTGSSFAEAEVSEDKDAEAVEAPEPQSESDPSSKTLTMDRIVLSESETGRQAQYLLLGEYREQIMVHPPSSVPPADILPESLRRFFIALPDGQTEAIAGEVETYLLKHLMLGEFGRVQDFESQVIFRSKTEPVRLWLHYLHIHSKSQIIRDWSKQHLDN